MLQVIVRVMTPLAVLSTFALAGCNGTMGLEPALSANASTTSADDEETVGRQMIGKPYKVGGKWYHPKEDEDYEATGLASWYGKDFHGSKTANGDINHIGIAIKIHIPYLRSNKRTRQYLALASHH